MELIYLEIYYNKKLKQISICINTVKLPKIHFIYINIKIGMI